MPLPDHLKDKRIALLLWNAEKRDDVSVWLGQLKERENQVYFVNPDEEWLFPLDEEQLTCTQAVAEELKEMLLMADFAISLTLGSLPDHVSREELLATGMHLD